jgi:fimbrial chaperone protein
MRGWICATLGAALFATCAGASPSDKSLEVAPTTLELKAGEAGLLYVANHSAAPINVQIDIYDWSQSHDGDRLALSDTAFVSPPLTTIAPGERQIIRVLAQPKTGMREASYRLRVSEIPDAIAKPAGVQVLLQFSIPVFVAGTKDDSAVSWSVVPQGSKLVLKAQNEGARTMKLAGLRISSDAGTSIALEPDVVRYVLPGAEQSWIVDAAALTGAEKLHIKGFDERSGKPVAADIGIAR